MTMYAPHNFTTCHHPHILQDLVNRHSLKQRKVATLMTLTAMMSHQLILSPLKCMELIVRILLPKRALQNVLKVHMLDFTYYLHALKVLV